MSKRFLTKLAGGVALGSAALLLGAPAAALADPGPADAESKQPKHEKEWKDKKDGDRKHHDKDGKRHKKDGKLQCTVDSVEQLLRNRTGDIEVNAEKGSTVLVFPIQYNNAEADTGGGPSVVVCVSDVEVDVTSKTSKRTPFPLNSVMSGGSGGGSDLLRQLGGPDGGLYVGPDGIRLGAAVPNGGVAAGDGGALVSGGTGGLAAAGAGMIGVAALGGMGLLRRRSAHGTVA